MQSREIPSQVFESISVDAIGPLSPPDASSRAQYIYVAVCNLSRFVIASAVRETTSKSLANFLLHHVYLVHGTCRKIHLDNAASNKSEFMMDFFKYWRTEPVFSSAHHHAAEGIVERMNRSIETTLRTFVQDNPKNWAKYLVSHLVFVSHSHLTRVDILQHKNHHSS
jgi:hypothetical protein